MFLPSNFNKFLMFYCGIWCFKIQYWKPLENNLSILFIVMKLLGYVFFLTLSTFHSTSISCRPNMYDTLLGALAFSNEQNKTFSFMELIFLGGRKKNTKAA